MINFKIIKIILVLLFQTIAFVGLSQKPYIIQSDTLVCYTHWENRRIAALLYKGIYSDTLLTIQGKQIDVLGQLVEKYKFDSLLYSQKITTFEKKFKMSDSLYNKTYDAYLVENKKAKTLRTIGFISGGLNILLLIILL